MKIHMSILIDELEVYVTIFCYFLQITELLYATFAIAFIH